MNQNTAAEADAGEQIPVQKSKRKVSVCQVWYTFLVVSSLTASKQGRRDTYILLESVPWRPTMTSLRAGSYPTYPKTCH